MLYILSYCAAAESEELKLLTVRQGVDWIRTCLDDEPEDEKDEDAEEEEVEEVVAVSGLGELKDLRNGLTQTT